MKVKRILSATFLRASITLIAAALMFASCSDDNSAVGPTKEQPIDTLMSITIPAHYLSSTDVMWVFISDKNGKTIGEPQQVSPWDKKNELVFPVVAGFTDETFTVTLFSFDKGGKGKTRLYYIDSYPNVTRGHHQLGVNLYISLPQRPDVHSGSFKATITNVPPGSDNVTVCGDGGGTVTLTPATATASINGFMFDNKGEAMISIYDANSTTYYKILADVPEGFKYALDFNDFTPMESNVLTIEGATGNSIIQAGIRNESVRFVYKFVSDSDVNLPKNNVAVSNPADTVFTSYDTYLSWSEPDNVYRGIEVHASTPLNEVKKLDVNFVSHMFLDGDIEMEFTGEATEIMLYGDNETMLNDTTYGTVWEMHMPFSNSVKCKRPRMPSQLAKRYYPAGYFEPDVSFVTVSNDNVRDYDDNLGVIFNGATGRGPLENYEILSTRFDITSQGGRSSTHLQNAPYISFDPWHGYAWKKRWLSK